MHRRRRRTVDEAEINITPLLDIVFIMLIFFIVTTSFVKELAVEASRPSSQPVQTREVAELIAVRIDQSGLITVNDRVVDLRAVRANVEAGLAVNPGASVVVIPHRDANAGILVRVIDQARLAGADDVSLGAEAG